MQETAVQEIEAWLVAEGRKKEWLARQLGINRATLSQWLARKYRPTEPHRIMMHKICGVVPDAWGRV